MAFPIRVTTSSNIDRWLRKFEKDTGKFKANMVKEPEELAKMGQRLGIAIAPRDKYATLIHAIAWKVVSKDKTNAKAAIWIKPIVHPFDNRSRLTQGRADKYATIHHMLAKGDYSRGQARTGDPHWMFTVSKELQRRYKQRVIGHLSKLRGKG